jgi:hypothetical protein
MILAASCVVTPGVGLWTRDRRLRRVAGELGIAVRADSNASGTSQVRSGQSTNTARH